MRKAALNGLSSSAAPWFSLRSARFRSGRAGAWGCRISAIIPYLRGYGETRFLSPATMRSGQQAAIGRDLLELMDALKIPNAVLVGFDWGGRAACVVSALWPERVRELVPATAIHPGYRGVVEARFAGTGKPPLVPILLPYRARPAGLQANRHDFCKLLWKLWSPSWKFDDATYDCTAVSFDDPDFVAVVIHSYRHRFGYVAGDPALQMVEGAASGKASADPRAVHCASGRSRRRQQHRGDRRHKTDYSPAG